MKRDSEAPSYFEVLEYLAARYRMSVDEVESTLTVSQIELRYFLAQRNDARAKRQQAELIVLALHSSGA